MTTEIAERGVRGVEASASSPARWCRFCGGEGGNRLGGVGDEFKCFTCIISDANQALRELGSSIQIATQGFRVAADTILRSH